MDRRKFLKGSASLGIGASLLPLLKVLPASAATGETAVVVFGGTINSLDIHRTGTNRDSYQVAINCYDRLVTFGTKELSDGSLSYDFDNVRPELAESWEISDDGTVMFNRGHSPITMAKLLSAALLQKISDPLSLSCAQL